MPQITHDKQGKPLGLEINICKRIMTVILHYKICQYKIGHCV